MNEPSAGSASSHGTQPGRSAAAAGGQLQTLTQVPAPCEAAAGPSVPQATSIEGASVQTRGMWWCLKTDARNYRAPRVSQLGCSHRPGLGKQVRVTALLWRVPRSGLSRSTTALIHSCCPQCWRTVVCHAQQFLLPHCWVSRREGYSVTPLFESSVWWVPSAFPASKKNEVTRTTESEQGGEEFF